MSGPGFRRLQLGWNNDSVDRSPSGASRAASVVKKQAKGALERVDIWPSSPPGRPSTMVAIGLMAQAGLRRVLGGCAADNSSVYSPNDDSRRNTAVQVDGIVLELGEHNDDQLMIQVIKAGVRAVST